MTRIVGGRFGGRRIAVPSGRGTRPTTDRVREALFNVLAAQWDLDGVAVLDLYAGSGALGLEALSRGAATATFVEADRRAADVIATNARTLDATGVVVRCGDVGSVLVAGTARPVDVVFADPPYDVTAAALAAVLTTLGERGWVATGATAVVERATAGPELDWPPAWTARQVRRYGDTRLEFGEFA